MARKILPAATVPEEGYDLLQAFAQSQKLSISEALRLICRTSPALQEFAGKADLAEYFEVDSWGGSRRGEDQDEQS